MERATAKRECRRPRPGGQPTAICIDAIQAHGGYGYIDEYPVAGLLRDAISLQARAGGRRLHVARVAERGLGPEGRSPLMTSRSERHRATVFSCSRCCDRGLRSRSRSERRSFSGDFAHGDKLPPEIELAQQFGVSRPTVREALSSLTSAGLIRKVPGVSGGSFVNTATLDSLGRNPRVESLDNIVRLGALDIDELTVHATGARGPGCLMGCRRTAYEHAARRTSRTSSNGRRRRPSTTRRSCRTTETSTSTIASASGNRLLAAFVSAIHDATRPRTVPRASPPRSAGQPSSSTSPSSEPSAPVRRRTPPTPWRSTSSTSCATHPKPEGLNRHDH